jgi:hypothetical protein
MKIGGFLAFGKMRRRASAFLAAFLKQETNSLDLRILAALKLRNI